MNMRIPFRTPVVKGDITMQAVTVDYHIVHADHVQTYPDSKAFPVAGLSARSQAALAEWRTAFALDIADEYQTGAVTARANALQPQGDAE